MAKKVAPNQPEVVLRTGLAVVHEGERIYPAEDSAAKLVSAEANIVNYYFPVEIEVIGAGALDELVENIYDALHREFSAQG
jgi:hypothetical protein